MKVLARYGRGVCPVCNRVGSLDENANLRRHWTSGRGSPVCSGSYNPAAKTLSSSSPPAGTEPTLRGRLPLSGDRTFSYEAPHPLSLADVKRITSTLLLHVDGVAEKAWIEAVAAGLVADMETT